MRDAEQIRFDCDNEAKISEAEVKEMKLEIYIATRSFRDQINGR